MARPLRIEYPGAWYHVMNQGRRRKEIFKEKENYLLFVDLLIQTPRGNLSGIMRHVNGIYTQLFNNRHGLDGQLFRGRYKAILVWTKKAALFVRFR